MADRSQQLSLETHPPDLLRQLYQLLQGERDMVRVYSRALGSDVCFVNTSLIDPGQITTRCPVYTTRELAQIISLPEGDFQRFHARLVG